MKTKKILIFLLIISCLIVFSGCNLNFTNKFQTDSDVNMTPRLISLNEELPTSEIISNVKSAIVGIKSNLSNGYAVGSGVAIKQGGYILTNQHVISNSKGITLYFADKSTASASLIWQDSSIDLAVIKSSKEIPYLECETEEVLVGQDVLAIGTPLSLAFQHTVTKGIISAVDRTLEMESLGGSVSYLQDLIQHDASINPGNSGGPLINSHGRVVGINTLKATDAEGIGFAIPIVTGKSIVERLSANNSYTAPYMGVMGISSDFAKSKEYQVNSEGLYLIGVDEKSQAGLVGLLPGDIIYQIDDVKIKSFLDLRSFMYSHSIGDEVVVYLNRNGENITLYMKLGDKFKESL